MSSHTCDILDFVTVNVWTKPVHIQGMGLQWPTPLEILIHPSGWGDTCLVILLCLEVTKAEKMSLLDFKSFSGR